MSSFGDWLLVVVVEKWVEDRREGSEMGETKEIGVYIGDDIVLYMIFGFEWWRLEFTMSMGVL